MFDRVISGRAEDFPPEPRERGQFVHEKRTVVGREGTPVQVAFYELPPGRSNFPYHWHEAAAEVYVILSGVGVLRSPEGETEVGPGHVVAMPAGPAGAHRLRNASATEPLRYVDIDTVPGTDVFHYPDSGGTGYRGPSGRSAWFRDEDEVDHYDAEPDAG